MSIIQEFKEFAVKGNVMDLAVGVIIGGAFGKIIDSNFSQLKNVSFGIIETFPKISNVLRFWQPANEPEPILLTDAGIIIFPLAVGYAINVVLSAV